MIEPPKTTPEYMHPAWAAALQAALLNDDIRGAFERETGMRWAPPRHPIETMIDESTGFTSDFIHKFADWFNRNVWGDVTAPDETERHQSE
jgi:hypothetical protein